jgi:hypothetical protein
MILDYHGNLGTQIIQPDRVTTLLFFVAFLTDW